VYAAWSDRSVRRGSGFWNEARGFDRSNALAGSGNDEALFHDSVGNDVLTTWWDRAIMHGDGYWNDARGFDRALAHSTSGSDLAVLRDSSAYDEVHAAGNSAYITGESYRNEVQGFRRVDVIATDNNISDVAYFDSIDFLFHCSANWTHVGV
jgi:hypothetical protein